MNEAPAITPAPVGEREPSPALPGHKGSEQMTTDVAADGSAPIQQSPTKRAGLVARLQAAPDINHARIVPAQREAEYIIPQSLRDDLIEFASQAAQPAEADGVDRDLVRDAYISGYEQALYNTSLGPEAFYDEWVHVGCPPPVPPFSPPAPKAPATDAGSALSEARVLIQEAKGLADGENGGSVTDHLDLAENWIGKAEAALAATPKAPATDAANTRVALVERLFAEIKRQCAGGAGEYDADSETGLVSINADLDLGGLAEALATPPAPNDDLRAALERIELLASNHGGWADADARKCVADIGLIATAALKENHRG